MAKTTIKLTPNGPYQVNAEEVELIDPTGKVIPTVAGQDLWICRCGQSGKKPFCDGTHKRTGFQASEPYVTE